MTRVASRGVANPDLAHTGANGRHRLPIGRRRTLLHLVQFVTALLARIVGKVAQTIEQVSVKNNWFYHHGASLYNNCRTRVTSSGFTLRPGRPKHKPRGSLGLVLLPYTGGAVSHSPSLLNSLKE